MTKGFSPSLDERWGSDHGLFIENDLVPYLSEFESDKYDKHCHFVHLLEYIRQIRFEERRYPVDPQLVEPIGLDVTLPYDLTYLKNVYTHMSNMGLSPRVRVKYLSAWQMIQKRHRDLLNVLERNDFNPDSICNLSWKSRFDAVGTIYGLYE